MLPSGVINDDSIIICCRALKIINAIANNQFQHIVSPTVEKV